MFSVACFSLPAPEKTDREKHVRIGGVPVRTLGPDDTLIYLCVHGSVHVWYRLFWLLDVAKLVESGQIRNWDHLADRAARSGTLRPLAQGLVLAHVLLGSRLPDAVLRCSAADRAVMGMVRKAILIMLMPADSPGGPFSLPGNLRRLHRFAMVRAKRYKLQALLGFLKPVPAGMSLPMMT